MDNDYEKLVREMTAQEGLKEQVSIAQMREILAKLSDRLAWDTHALVALLQHGIDRTAARKEQVEKCL